MGIDINRLSPTAQRQIAEKLARRNTPHPSAAPTPSPQGEGKYHNHPTERNGIRFDSQKEARRYDELMILLRRGDIRDLKLQPQFTLQEAYTTPEGKRVQAIRYQADFSYDVYSLEPEGKYCMAPVRHLVVEDVKSKATKTRVYEIKKKLMRERFGIEITEVE